MPKQYLEIRDFYRGMFNWSDQSEIPDGAAAYVHGIDPIAPRGILRGLPANANAVFQYNVWKSRWLRFSTQWDLIIIPYGASHVAKVADYYNEAGGRTLTTQYGGANYGSTIEVNKQSARLGRGTANEPRYVGYITGLSGIQVAPAPLQSSGVSLNGSSAAQNEIALENISAERNKIFLAYSLIFDGAEEGTLITLGSQNMVLDPGKSVARQYGTTEPESVTVNLGTAGQFTVYFAENESGPKNVPAIYRDYHVVLDKASLPDRATHINLYLAWSTAQDAAVPDTYYYLIKTFTDVSDGQVTFDFTWKSQLFESYEASSGRPQTLTEQDVYYELSTQLDGYHWVGVVNVSTLSGGTNYLLRSELYDFDSFDWSKNYVELPTRPTAMVGWNGRIYAFDQYRTYVVNPYSMEIEDTIEGAGAYNSTSVLATEYGLFHADRNNVYRNTGSGSRPIAWPIMEAIDQGTGWRDINWANISRGPYLTWDNRTSSLVVIVEESAVTPLIWLYHMDSESWVSVDAASKTVFNGAYHERDGELILSWGGGNDSDEWFALDADTQRTGYVWVSRYLTLGQPSIRKKFYQCFIDGDFSNFAASMTVEWRSDPNGSWTAMTMNTELANKRYYGYFDTGYDAVTPWANLRGVQIRLTALTGYRNDVHAVGISYRHKGITKQLAQ